MAGERLSESWAFLFLKLDVEGLAQWRRRPGTSLGETQQAVKPKRKRTMRMHTGAAADPLSSVFLITWPWRGSKQCAAVYSAYQRCCNKQRNTQADLRRTNLAMQGQKRKKKEEKLNKKQKLKKNPVP